MDPKTIANAQSAAGPSLLEMMWDELDHIMDRLMADGQQWFDKNGDHANWQAWGELRGQAQGVAYCIALVEQPYAPNVPDVKERAMERWEEAHG